MESGCVGGFDWVESKSFDLGKLMKFCPETVLGKYIVISSFDSGPLEPSPDELAKGWRKQGPLLSTSRVTDISELPFDQYDEWYVFPQTTAPNIAEVFVNYSGFSLVPPEKDHHRSVAPVCAQADLVGAKHYGDLVIERQMLFWEQLKECNPESFIADGDSFIFASRNSELFQRVSKTVSRLE